MLRILFGDTREFTLHTAIKFGSVRKTLGNFLVSRRLKKKEKELKEKYLEIKEKEMNK